MIGPAKRMLARLSSEVNRIAPTAKYLLPKPVLRFILLHILDVNREYKPLDELPSRRFLEHEVLPWISKHCARVLFVGTASYTYRYERLFDPAQLTTIDANPNTRVWGASRHIVAPVQDILRHRPPGSFDCVVLNGVFGFGVDTADDMRATIKAIHAILRPGGLLLVGWNTSQHLHPESLGVLEPYFLQDDKATWGPERRFPAETHVYNFYTRQPAADHGQPGGDLETKK